jgi:hypothetical protein
MSSSAITCAIGDPATAAKRSTGGRRAAWANQPFETAFQMAAVAISRHLIADILRLIADFEAAT